MRLFYSVAFILSFICNIDAQFTGCISNELFYDDFFAGTLHVVLLDDDKEYNSRMKDFMKNQWKHTDYVFVEEKEMASKVYRKLNADKFFLHTVELEFGGNGNDRKQTIGNISIKTRGDGNTSLSIFRLDHLNKAEFGKEYIHVNVEASLAFFSFVREVDMKMFKRINESYMKDFDKYPLADHLELGLLYINNTLEVRKKINIKFKIFDTCREYNEKLIAEFNKPDLLRGKTILISNTYLEDFDEEELNEYANIKYKIVEPKEITAHIKEGTDKYAVLSSSSHINGISVSILDLESGEIAFMERGLLDKKIFKSLNQFLIR